MKHKTLFGSVFVLSLLTAVLALVSMHPIVDAQSLDPLNARNPHNILTTKKPGVRYVHTATIDNIDGNETILDHVLLNDAPDAIFFIAQNRNPGNIGDVYNNHPVGVKYNNITNRWAIINEDLVVMPEGASFNISIPEVKESDTSVFTHTTTTANMDGNLTYLDHALINDNSDVILLVTQNVNPNGAAETYNGHSIGVFYDDITGMWAILNEDLADMPEGAAFNVEILAADSSVYVHTADATNTTNNYTVINNPLTNENPNAIVFVTQNVNPNGDPGVYNNQNIGVWYSASKKKWAIFNQEGGSNDMAMDAAFNVIIPTTETTAFVHSVATSGSNSTTIDHSLINENPSAIMFITQIWNDGGVGGIYNDHPIGVAYDEATDLWTIINEDQAVIPDGSSFNILVPTQDTSVFIHTATADNISDTAAEMTHINHPLSNNNSDANLFITQNWNPGGGAGVYNSHPVGVFYDTSLVEPKWAIYNKDHADMPEGASFNVFVADENPAIFVHTAVPANIDGNFTYFNQALTLENPNSMIFVTQTWNPDAGYGADNVYPIGVYNDSSSQLDQWAIFNQDDAYTMPENAAFNVFVINLSITYLPIVFGR